MLTSVIAFVVAFGLLVLVHEFGHFWVARRNGVAVEKFSIGFGPKLFGFHWKETLFQVSLLPLGGFVKMKGESETEAVDPADTSAFSNQSVRSRSAIVLAGPVMNLALSFALMPLVFWIGKPEPAFLSEPPVIERILPGTPAETAGLKIGDRIVTIQGKKTATWQEALQAIALQPVGGKAAVTIRRKGASQHFDLEVKGLEGSAEPYLGLEKFFGPPPTTVIEEIEVGGPAADAGLKPGDTIVAVAGEAVGDWDALVRAIQKMEGRPFVMEMEREGKRSSVTVQPKWNEAAGRYLIGIQGGAAQTPLDFVIHRYSFWEGLKEGMRTNWNHLVLTLTVLKKLVTLELSYKTLGGPVRIATTLAKASASGLADFLFFTAFLSLQLAILNLLPIPVLDGGHLLFYLIEAVFRRPLNVKIRMIAQQVGFVLLIALILAVTWNDIAKMLR